MYFFLFIFKELICPSLMWHILIRGNSFIDLWVKCWSYWESRGRKTKHGRHQGDFTEGNNCKTNGKCAKLLGHVLADALLFKQSAFGLFLQCIQLKIRNNQLYIKTIRRNNYYKLMLNNMPSHLLKMYL